MADLSPTVGSVAWSSGGICKDFNAGETITAGMSVYLSASNLWMMAQCDGTAIQAGSGTRTGISLHASLSGQPLAVQETGVVNLGATLAIGTLYVISTAFGKIAPFADLVSTNKITILGIGQTTALLDMAYKGAYPGGYTGLAVP